MKKLIKYNLIALLALVFVVSSCDDEDYTGYSDLTATAPTITVSGIAGGGYSFIETNSVYSFDVTLSAAQISDISLYVSQVDGNATAGADYAVENTNSRVFIRAGSTTGTLTIKVFEDELIEGTETFQLQIGDERTANASITPILVDFTIDNYTNADFSFELSWETDVADAIGLDIDADEVADLRMLILDASDESVVHVVDGSAFESFHAMTDTLNDGTYLPDGDYLIATDIYSTIDVGDYDEVVTFDIALDFYQPGIYNNTMLTYDALFTNQFVCSSYRVILANFTKAGDVYTFDDDAVALPASPLSGEWEGLDASTVLWDEASQVVVELGCDLEITGLGFGWMENFWGEEVIAGGTIELQADLVTGIITIPDQYYMTTLYSGAVQDDYTIVGSGTVDVSGTYPTMHIEYEMTNYGTGWAQWCFDNGYLLENYFTAELTLDPAGLKALSNGEVVKFDLKNKPLH